jgi:hypothetical protein
VAEQSGRKTGKRKGAKKRERERKAIKAVKRAALAKRADAKAEAPAAKTKTRKAVPGASPATTVANLLRVGPDFDLAAVDPASTPGLVGDRKDAEAALAARTDELADLQERLYAAGRGGGNRALLLVIQGMDTSGKGGIMRHVVGSMDPQGVKLTSFKAPTAEEREKGYLWRIRQALPAPATSGCSTARTTRTCSSCGCTTWWRRPCGRAGTAGSTSSRRRWSSRAPPSSR